MAIDKDRKCAHPGCACPADPGSDYCSAQCQNQRAATNGAKCGCGHDACLQPQQPTRGNTPRGSYDPATRTQDQEKPQMNEWGVGDKH
jgi:hypothetical protein